MPKIGSQSIQIPPRFSCESPISSFLKSLKLSQARTTCKLRCERLFILWSCACRPVVAQGAGTK